MPRKTVPTPATARPAREPKPNFPKQKQDPPGLEKKLDPRPNATISTPIHWDELSSLDAPNTHTLTTIARRLAHQKTDRWRDFRSARRSLSEALASLHP